MFNKLKQVKDLRDKAKQLQSRLGEVEVEGSAAWNKVRITIDGNQSVKKVTIDPDMMADRAKLEGALVEAFNDAVKKVQRKMIEVMKQSGDLNLPGLQ
ncbi:MAG: YbaB/EbfC family nucleoid-associated protein [bacterium]